MFPVSSVWQHHEKQADGWVDEDAKVTHVGQDQHPEGDPIPMLVVAVDQLVDGCSLVDVQDCGRQVAANGKQIFLKDADQTKNIN